MHDIQFIRHNPQGFDAGLARRGLEPQAQAILAVDEKRRAILTELQQLQARRNEASKEIGAAMKAKDTARAEALKAEVAGMKDKLPALEEDERRIDKEMEELLAALPNLPAAETPDGKDEDDNVEVRRHGAPREMNFKPQEHFDLGEALGQMDFEAAARMSGARFVVLKKYLAKLERAIAAFMLDLHTGEFGYQEIAPPMLVLDRTMFGTGQLPKFADDQYHTENGFWLVPTAEVPLTNLAREQIIAEEELPWRMTAYTPCFRQEAGAAGKDTRGMIRMHQFSKVELVSITTPDKSEEEHERMTQCAEEVLKRLGLHFRTMALCTGDIGFSARKTYDIEVWLPGQDKFREISSCSNCGDFQARRMSARYRPKGDAKGAKFVHTLNGSGLAVGRTLVAILETYQQADGSIEVPEALRPYLGTDLITA
jgi:seryl-tRNA synthetase